MDINEDNTIFIKGNIKLAWQVFPKGGQQIESGDFGIISAKVIDVTEGEPKTSKYGTITLTGVMCAINKEEIYKVVAKEVENDKYGLQYEIVFIGTDVKLEKKEDQRTFLRKVLSEKQCEDIFEKFENPIKILDEKNTESLCQIKGIGVPTALKLIDKYESCKDFSEIYIKLDKYGLTNNAIQKLIKQYGSPSIVVAKVEANPYILIEEVDGIGWSKADGMALKSGIDEYSIKRVKAYIKYYLDNEANNGNTWVWTDDLIENIDGEIGYKLPQDALIKALTDLKEAKTIWTNKDQEIVALYRHFNLEKNIAIDLKRISEGENKFEVGDWKEKIKLLEKRQGWEFTEEQINGVQTILENQVVIIQGLAGTGKSTTVLGMLEVFQNEYNFAQTALSGRASCNLTEITGSEGYTIHRLLGFNPRNGFVYNKDNKLDTDIVILDELSMVGGDIFYKLIQSIKSGGKLVMLGDVGQLEAIGIANIMTDMIESGYIRCVNLTKIHRQASKSAIITESIKISEQQQIIDKNFIGSEIRGELQDLELDIYRDKISTHDRILDHFKKLMKIADTPFDIQVIVPLKDRGNASAYCLNNSLQKIVMDTTMKGLKIGENTKLPFTIYVGDKIINHKNNYKALNEEGIETPIFNGDLGVVDSIDYERQTLLVDFNTKGKIYINKKHLINIKLGYAITTHKIQGSSSPYVICGLDYSHYMLLNKEMVYTMLTRAKKYCVLCAENKALRYATSQSEVKNKQTFLKAFLTGEIPLK